MDLMEVRRTMMGVIAGMGNNDIVVEFIKEYTVSESWENDAQGNPVTIFQTLGLSIDDLSDLSQVFLMIFKNNQASNTSYKCDYMIRTKNSSTTSYVVRDNKNAIRSFVTNTSAWASIGTVIKVYKITYVI